MPDLAGAWTLSDESGANALAAGPPGGRIAAFVPCGVILASGGVVLIALYLCLACCGRT